MRYADFRAAGLCTSTGVVEDGCKTPIGTRCKRSGTHWTVAGADAIIALLLQAERPLRGLLGVPSPAAGLRVISPPPEGSSEAEVSRRITSHKPDVRPYSAGARHRCEIPLSSRAVWTCWSACGSHSGRGNRCPKLLEGDQPIRLNHVRFRTNRTSFRSVDCHRFIPIHVRWA